jgi:hypothetical protein
METQLRAHDDRPGWENESKTRLYGRLLEETCELWDAAHDQGNDPVWHAAADVANMAMMLADTHTPTPQPDPAPEAPSRKPALEIWTGASTRETPILVDMIIMRGPDGTQLRIYLTPQGKIKILSIGAMQIEPMSSNSIVLEGTRP